MKVTIPIAIATIASVMMLTNPSKAAYTQWAAQQFSTDLRSRLCQEASLPPELKDKGIDDFCKSSVNLLRHSGLPKVAIRVTTQRQNFLLFSVYTTETPGQVYRVVGAFGHFFSI
jgi:hypothetical protein